MFAGLAQEEEWFADKLSLFVALGPVTKITNTQAKPLQLAATFYTELDDTVALLGIHNLFPRNYISTGAMDLFCTHIAKICEVMESFFLTNKTDLDDDDRFKVYAGHVPNGASAKDIKLYAQNMKEDRF